MRLRTAVGCDCDHVDAAPETGVIKLSVTPHPLAVFGVMCRMMMET